MAEAVCSSSSSSRTSTPPPPAPTDPEVAQVEPSEVQPGKQADFVAGAEGGDTGLGTKIDKLLQKQRNELMYELRRLQHGDRPVTGQGHKEAVEEFFQRANADTPDPGPRPESVVVEVNALVERRPVSSALRSTHFRRQLETALRSAITTVSTRSQAPTQQRRVPPPPAPPVTGLSEFAATREEPSSTRIQPPQTHALPNRASPPTVQRAVPVSSLVPEVVAAAPAPPVAERVAAAVSVPAHHRVAHAQQWVQQIQHPSAGEVHVWGHIEETLREEFIGEISELVQRQLVTGTLEGGFRNVLETRMRNRLEQSGTDGQRVVEVLRSLPPSQHVRNDFSDLGILGPGQQQELNSDEMSVISATAAVTVPYAQSNMALSRELSSLKSQMKEMMTMMKLNFDMTLDIQRSVRQEVSAAIHGAGDEGRQGATASSLRSTPVNDTTCLICTESQVDTVLYQCGHMCVCHGCGVQLRQRGAHCPVCRAPIRDIIRAYKCNND